MVSLLRNILKIRYLILGGAIGGGITAGKSRPYILKSNWIHGSQKSPDDVDLQNALKTAVVTAMLEQHKWDSKRMDYLVDRLQISKHKQDEECRRPSLSIDQNAMALYEQGLRMAQRGDVQFRKNRAKFCSCESDQDFAAKLYGIRLAFRHIMDEPQTMQWLIQSGRIIIANLLRHDKKDPTEFFAVYDRMTAFLLDEKNCATICEELKQRKIGTINLWDVLFDMILLDAFEDLQKLPSAVTAVVRNWFIAASIKQSTLNSLLWSMIRLKRERLQIKNGFLAHFYDISQVITGSLTMGLLGGSDKEFQELCVYFKDQICDFVADIFNPAKVRYTTAEHLTEDLKKLLTDCIDRLKVKLSFDQVKLSNELLPI